MAIFKKYSIHENYKKEKSLIEPCQFVGIHQFLDELEAGKEIHYINCTFNFLIDLSNYNFNKKVRFHNCIFKKGINCENTTFNQLVDFYQSRFEDNQYFHLTDFLNISIFSETTFEKAVIFRHNKVSNDTYISFEKAIFKNGLDISNSNFWCTLQVYGIKIEQSIPNPSSLVFYQEKNIGNTMKDNKLLNLNIRTYKGLRESYRRIKQEFRKSENNIEALGFHYHEMTIYSKELQFKSDKNDKKLNRFDKNKIILYFNRISNDYNLSWYKGLCFTFLTSLLFFLTINIILIFTKEISITYSLQYFYNNIDEFMNFINPLVWNYKLFDTKNPLAIIITFIGKIFISYGYYQTIQAFRKYGKN